MQRPLTALRPGYIQRQWRRAQVGWRQRYTAANPRDLWRWSARQAPAPQAARLPAVLRLWGPTALVRRVGALYGYYVLRLPSYYVYWPEPTRGVCSPLEQKWLTAIVSTLRALVTVKLKLKGKSFNWHRRRGGLVLKLGHSHAVWCAAPYDARWRRKKRAKLLLFGTNLWRLRAFAQAVVAWRPANVYHARGLRLARQRLKRKVGKVSAYR